MDAGDMFRKGSVIFRDERLLPPRRSGMGEIGPTRIAVGFAGRRLHVEFEAPVHEAVRFLALRSKMAFTLWRYAARPARYHISDPSTLAPKPGKKPFGPHKLARQDGETKRDREDPGARSDEHNYAQ
jgi:hypothetical protein